MEQAEEDSEPDQPVRERLAEAVEAPSTPCGPSTEDHAEDSDGPYSHPPAAKKHRLDHPSVRAAMSETPQKQCSTWDQKLAAGSDDVRAGACGRAESLDSLCRAAVNSVMRELGSKNCRRTPKIEAGSNPETSSSQSHAATRRTEGKNDGAENSDDVCREAGTNRQDEDVWRKPQPGSPDPCIYIKLEPPDDYPSSSQPPSNTDGCLTEASSQDHAGGQAFSIKEEPECSDGFGGVYHHGTEEDNAYNIRKELHPDHPSPHLSRADTKSNWLRIALPSSHGPQHGHPFSASSTPGYGFAEVTHSSSPASGANGEGGPYGFAQVTNSHTFPDNFKPVPREGAAESAEQVEEYSDDSDCDPLPVHFEAQGVEGEGEAEAELLYECGMCQIAFPLPALVHEHVIQHEASDRCYVCNRCKKSFPQIAFLTQHMPTHTFAEGAELQYDNPKSFVCHVCSKVFGRLYELNRHQKIHSGSKPFMCGVCHKMFSRGDELNRHTKVHSGEKPYPCNECSRAFITNHELTQHKKSHFVNKPYICSICSRGFLRADKLFHHQQMHAGERPFECDICQKGFITPSEMRQHRKIHSGVKPFVCEVCCKAYLKVNDLNRHMKMHTGVKPFTCDVCGKAFHRTDVLTRHKKIHNKVKRSKRDMK